jgi:hypothetical protein
MKDFNFLIDMKEKPGCPKCQFDVEQIRYSGGDIGPRSFITKGHYRIAVAYDDLRIDQRPDRTVDMCEACHSIWDTRYRWPDRPPIILNSTWVDPKNYKTFFEDLSKDMYTSYQKTNASQGH